MKTPRCFEVYVLIVLSLLLLGTSTTHAQAVDFENKCVFNCSALTEVSKLKPVCGSDGHPHPSLCMLEYESCLHPDKLLPVPVASKNCVFFGALSFNDPRLSGILPVGIRPLKPIVDDEEEEIGGSSDSSSSWDDDDGSDSDASSLASDFLPTAAQITSPVFEETHDLEGDVIYQNTEWLGDGNDSGGSNASSFSGESGDDGDEGGGSARCETMCLTRYDPVCASDGKTYSNRCVLSVAKCLDPTLTEVHAGDCRRSSPVDLPQALPEPPNAPYPLALEPTEKGYDPCAYVCPMFDAPVCSEDGHVYDNKCVYASAYCRDSTLEDATAEICKSA